MCLQKAKTPKDPTFVYRVRYSSWQNGKKLSEKGDILRHFII